MRSLFLAFVAIGAVALLVGSGAAAAQTATNETTAGNATGDYSERIDSRLVLVGHEWTGDGFELEFRSDGRTLVTVTQSIQRAEGSGQMSISQQSVPDGHSSMFIAVEPIAGEAAVAITTAESIDQGTGTYVSTGVYSPGPWTRTTSGAGWVGGITVMAGMLVAAAYKQMKDTHDAPEAL